MVIDEADAFVAYYLGARRSDAAATDARGFGGVPRVAVLAGAWRTCSCSWCPGRAPTLRPSWAASSARLNAGTFNPQFEQGPAGVARGGDGGGGGLVAAAGAGGVRHRYVVCRHRPCARRCWRGCSASASSRRTAFEDPPRVVVFAPSASDAIDLASQLHGALWSAVGGDAYGGAVGSVGAAGPAEEPELSNIKKGIKGDDELTVLESSLRVMEYSRATRRASSSPPPPRRAASTFRWSQTSSAASSARPPTTSTAPAASAAPRAERRRVAAYGSVLRRGGDDLSAPARRSVSAARAGFGAAAPRSPPPQRERAGREAEGAPRDVFYLSETGTRRCGRRSK